MNPVSNTSTRWAFQAVLLLFSPVYYVVATLLSDLWVAQLLGISLADAEASNHLWLWAIRGAFFMAYLLLGVVIHYRYDRAEAFASNLFASRRLWCVAALALLIYLAFNPKSMLTLTLSTGLKWLSTHTGLIGHLSGIWLLYAFVLLVPVGCLALAWWLSEMVVRGKRWFRL